MTQLSQHKHNFESRHSISIQLLFMPGIFLKWICKIFIIFILGYSVQEIQLYILGYDSYFTRNSKIHIIWTHSTEVTSFILLFTEVIMPISF